MHQSRPVFISVLIFAFLIASLAAVAQSPLRFVPVAPCRLVDTRNVDGPFGGPSIQGGSSRSFPIPLQTSCQIPATAAAYSLNVTLVPLTGEAVWFLSIWPTGEGQPNVSTMNSYDARFKANAAIVLAGNQGAVSVYVSNTANVVLDIDGYFEPASGSNLAFYALKPCRVADTRWANGELGGPYLQAKQERMLPVLKSTCGIPGTAQAYSFNFTSIPRTGPLWVFSAWPDGQPQPGTSTLNAPTGTVVANAAIVPAGTAGGIDVWASDNSDLAVDVNGYFAPGGQGGLSLYAVAPCRVLDTRTMGIKQPFTGLLTPPVDVVNSVCNTPQAAQAFVFNASIVPVAGPVYFLTLWPDGELRPNASTLNAYDGAVTSNMAIVPTTNGAIDAYSAGLSQLILDISSYFAMPAPLSITTTSLPAGSSGSAYSATLAATGGITPYTWTVIAGALPAGFNLNAGTGTIAGTPLGTGTSSFTVQAADADVPPRTASAPFEITIGQYLPLSIVTNSFSPGTLNVAFSGTLVATGGLAPYTWSIIGGSLPANLGLNGSTGLISGTPTAAGTSNFTAQVTDSELQPATSTKPLSIIINSGGGDPGVLKGNYAFALNGFNSTGPWTLAGSFQSDGQGNITSGVIDGNSVSGQPFNTTITGTYSIATSGLNTLTIQGQSFGPMTFAFVLSSSGNGTIIEYDDTTGQGGRGAGVLRKQDPTAFSLSKLSGGYVFGMTGADPTPARMVDVGVFALASGSISNGACVVNHGGSFSTCTFAGSLSAINTQTGRGVSTIQSSFGGSHQAVYVVTSGELIMDQIDSVPATQVPMLLGSALKQTGPFNKSTLNGTTIFQYQSIQSGDRGKQPDDSGGADQSGVMLLGFDGNGNFSILAADENNGGTITQQQTGTGTYTINPNGAVAFSSPGQSGLPTGFLVDPNHGFFVGSGSSPVFGTLEPQSGGPFSNASLAGTYAASSLAPLDYANGDNEVMLGPGDGVGTLTLSGDSSRPWGLDQWLNHNINYSIASNGRGTAQAQGDKSPAIVYTVSPTKFIVIMPQTDAEMVVFEH